MRVDAWAREEQDGGCKHQSELKCGLLQCVVALLPPLRLALLLLPFLLLLPLLLRLLLPLLLLLQV